MAFSCQLHDDADKAADIKRKTGLASKLAQEKAAVKLGGAVVVSSAIELGSNLSTREDSSVPAGSPVSVTAHSVGSLLT